MPNHNLPLGHLDACQVCASKDLQLIIDLGFHPPCDSLLTRDQLKQPELSYPLRLLRCGLCGLVQIDYAVAPEVLFYREYPYRSGITETLVKNLMGIAVTLCASLKLDPEDFVVDLGSNDGTILKGFQSQGMKVLGVEPTDIAKIAIANGIPTLQRFFDRDVVREIRKKHGPARVVTAANMFAHVQKLGDLIQGAEDLLTDDGMFLTESHYLVDLLDTVQYDSIYHEHLKYYSLKPLIRMMDAYNFTVVDAERIPNYGGSIRVYSQKGRGRPVSERLQTLIADEDRLGIYDGAVFAKFRGRVVQSKIDLQSLLVDLRRQGQSVVGIGCPGRSSTLLNYCAIDTEMMPYIAEQSSSLKLGLFAPGQHIPIVDEKRMFEKQPDYAIMLSWHYSAPIIRKLRERGLRSNLILPLPEVQVLSR